MSIPTQFGINVNTPEPLQVTIDMSERTMVTIAFVAIVAGIIVRKIKRV